MKVKKKRLSVNELLKTTKLHEISSNETEKILEVIEKTETCSLQDDHITKFSSTFSSDSSKKSFNTFRSPDHAKTNLINLSFSQPSTPRTPFLKPFPCATPSFLNTKRSFSFGFTPMIKSNFGGIPSTPMLNESLRVVSTTENGMANKPLDFPDILELIDDDQKPLEIVDKEVKKYTEVNLCDKTVVDYLLDLTKDYQFTAPIKSPVVSAQESPKIRRKCRRAKPVIYTDSKVYKEDKRKRAKEQRKRRKERMNKQSSGTRRSLRVTSHRVKYKY